MTVKKYRKKPVVIEAVQFDGTYDCYLNTIEPFCGADKVSPFTIDRFIIQTLEGNHWAIPGDYIIKGIKGEFYPCNPDIFWSSYEPVEDL